MSKPSVGDLLRRLGSFAKRGAERAVASAGSLERAADLANRHYAPCVVTDRVDPYHKVFPEFVDRCNRMQRCRVLEIGSREVCGVSRRGNFADTVTYVGFDIHAGPGVDVAGDAHDLCRYFQEGCFDAVFSISVFEHLAFPWKAVMEMNRVMRIGGLCYVSTHPTWPPHELPWDFWRFPLAGLKVLFAEPMGFRILQATEGLPARLHSLAPDPPTRSNHRHTMWMGVALIAEKIGTYDRDKLRWDVSLSEVLESEYPNRGPAKAMCK